MVTFFSKLHDEIVKEAKAVGLVKRHTVTKQSFTDNLKMLITRYHTFVGSIGSLPVTDRQRFADRIYIHKNDTKSKGCGHYITLASECKTLNDTKIAFDSIVSVAKAIENVLANFQANVDIIFEGGVDVNIHSAKLSHVAAFGLIENADMYIDYAVTLLSAVTYETIENNGVREINAPLPYRYKFLEDKFNDFLQFHRSMLNGGNQTYLETYKGLKKSMDDIRVANPDTGSNISMIEDTRLVSLSKGLFGQFSLNPFKWLGEQWNLIRNNKYLKIASEKEALVAHVALLQMDMAQQDPNSAEYRKLVKVIDTYNKMIAEMDRKLDKYYNENK